MNSSMHSVRRGTCTTTALLLTLAGLGGGCGGEAAAAAGPRRSANSLEQDGIRVDFAIEPLTQAEPPRPLQRGDTARVTLRVSDTTSRQPISGLQLGAWLLSRPTADAPAPDDEGVRTIVRRLVSSGLEANGTTNLNSWFFATLNTDHTLTLIDPLLDFSRTHMKGIVELPCAGTDLLLGADGVLLFLALPERGEVAVVDSGDMTLRQSLAVGLHPTRLRAQPITGTIWAVDDRGPAVHAIDGRTGQLGAAVEIGSGDKLLAFDAEGQWTFAAACDSGDVVAVATVDGSRRHLMRCDTPLSGLAWSDTAQELYALAADGRQFVCKADGTRTASPPMLPPGCGPLWAVRGGRFLLAAERGADRLHAIDAAVRAPARTIPTGDQPCQISCSDQFAFVLCAGTRELTLLPLSGLSDPEQVATMQVPIGQLDPTTPMTPTGDLIAAGPDRMSTLIAAPEEKQVYFYSEGTNAPMGAYQNYGRVPQALCVIDRSLREVAPGVYSTIVPLDQMGTVDLYLYLPQPTQLFGRFDFQVEVDPATLAEIAARKPGVVPRAVDAAATLTIGHEGRFQFRLEQDDGDQVTGLDDVRVLVHQRFGNWQTRLPAVALADGRYEVALTLPAKGPYGVRVQCPSRRLTYATHRPLTVTASDDVVAGDPAAESPGAPVGNEVPNQGGR